MEIVIEGAETNLCWRESFRGDIAAGSYISRGLERPVLERELRGDIAARSYRSRGLLQPVPERALRGEAKGCNQRRGGWEGPDHSLEI